MAGRALVTEAEMRGFLSYYGPRRHWHRADRRTNEGRAQELALLHGWIEPVPPGTGYRVLFPAAEAFATAKMPQRNAAWLPPVIGGRSSNSTLRVGGDWRGGRAPA
jgi:hypothetical protein